jgi:hypothetical protein
VIPSLQGSSSLRIPATPADGYFRYIAESVVNADFTEAKRNRQDERKKNKCCILIIIGICFMGNWPEAFLSCFVLCEAGVIAVLVNTITDT